MLLIPILRPREDVRKDPHGAFFADALRVHFVSANEIFEYFAGGFVAFGLV